MKRLSLTHILTALAVTVTTVGCGTGDSSHTAALTAALENEAWNDAQWISVVDAPVVSGPVNDHENGRSADGASWFVADITNEGRVTAARWMTTALGVYQLYVNGRTVGREVLKPGFTHTQKTRRSFTYDVTPLLQLKAGQTNRLAVQVTPGWWADKIVTPWGHEGMVGRKCAFRGVIELTLADGSTRRLCTDTISWRAAIAGPVTHAGIFDGEAYDARQALTDDMLRQPEGNSEFQGEVVPTDGAEVYHRDDLALLPVRAYVWKDTLDASDEAYGRVDISREYNAGELMELNAGESREVTLRLHDEAYSYWSVPEQQWVQDGGLYTVEIGASSRDIRLRQNIELPSDGD